MKWLFFLLLLLSSLCYADTDVIENNSADTNIEQANAVFDWAEQSFPQLFTPAGQETVELAGYLVRYYPDSQSFIGAKNDRVYVYGDEWHGLQDVGALSFVLYYIETGEIRECATGESRTARCSVSTQYGIGEKMQHCTVKNEWGEFGDCSLTSCLLGYKKVGNRCVEVNECKTGAVSTTSCSLANGTGVKKRYCTTHNTWGEYGACEARFCDTGYAKSDGQCAQACITIGKKTWEIKPNEPGLRDINNKYVWYDSSLPPNDHVLTNITKPWSGFAHGDYTNLSTTPIARGDCRGSKCDTESYVKAVNRKRLCGFNNWRMPTLTELRSVQRNPYLKSDDRSHAQFWTSTSAPIGSYQSKAYFVNLFSINQAPALGQKFKGRSVLLVRDGQLE